MTKRFPPERWNLPDIVNPPDSICYVVPVPNDKFHVAAFMGAIYALTWSKNWGRDDTNKAAAVSRVWQAIFDNLQFCPAPLSPPNMGAGGEDENMIRQNPDNPCELQTSIDGTTWCTFADFSLCLPAPSQPGGGTEQPTPGGGEACYQGEILASQLWLLPTIVSTGDIIDLQTITGAGNDGTVSPWFCPDGTTFFAGGCIGGTGGLDGSDPLPTVNHMRILYLIDGTYYDAMAGPFTVPGGVANQQVDLLVNDSVLSDNAGSYQFKVCVTNNAATTWSHVFDFTLSNGGWAAGIVGGTAQGTWVPGVGWQQAFTANDGGGHSTRRLRILRTISPVRDLTEMTALYDFTPGTTIDTSAGQNFGSVNGGGSSAFADTTWGSPNGTNVATGGAHVHSAQNLAFFDFYVSEANTPTDAGGTLTLKRITISGIGTDPF